jgi:hypothetical protein
MNDLMRYLVEIALCIAVNNLITLPLYFIGASGGFILCGALAAVLVYRALNKRGYFSLAYRGADRFVNWLAE